MTAAVSAELLKLRTTRAPWVTVLVITALAVAALVMNAALLGRPGQPVAEPSVLGDLVRAPGRLVGAGALLLGLLLSTTEYRYGTALTTRLGQPGVPRLVLGKAAAAGLAGAVLALAVEAVLLVGGMVLLAGRDQAVEPLRHGVPGTVAVTVVVALLHAVAGVGVGELVRNPALATGLVFGWVFVVEGVLPVVLREPGLDRWLPTGAVRAALTLGDGGRTAAVGLLLVAGYAAGLLVAGLVRAARTDP